MLQVECGISKWMVLIIYKVIKEGTLFILEISVCIV